jgi:hypothetical protein
MNSVVRRPDWDEDNESMRDVLRLELQCKKEDLDGSKIAYQRLIGRKLVDKALEGDIHAIREIFDRVDGKSPRRSASLDEPRHMIIEWNDGGSN